MRLDTLTVNTQDALQQAQSLAQRHNHHVGRLVVLCAVVLGVSASAWAQDFTFSAKADKTSVKIGDPIELTITLGGDLTGIKIPTFDFPKEFVVAARSQETNFSLRGRGVERSMSLLFVLVPQHAGTYQLGPFAIERNGTVVKTEPIPVAVEKSALPPRFQPQGERFTL